MELEKAIEIISDIIIYEHSASHTDNGDAIKLGIEALKRIVDQRKYNLALHDKPLPGETEE